MITFKQKGDFNKFYKYMGKIREAAMLKELDKYGIAGVQALSEATPVDTGKTAASWYYTITNENGVVAITFNNSNIQNGIPIAIILDTGHATGSGGWVSGRDYIRPAIRPVFDKLAKGAWEEVKKA